MARTLITTNTHASATTLSTFTSGIDSTYRLYIFSFFDVNPDTDGAEFNFNGSIDAGSNYNVSKTTNVFQVYHNEGGGSNHTAQGMDGYQGGFDLANATGDQTIAHGLGNVASESVAGELFLFNPSEDGTYVKHFYSTVNENHSGDNTLNLYVSGYFNNTANIDAVRFQMDSGDWTGTIKMYGVG